MICSICKAELKNNWCDNCRKMFVFWEPWKENVSGTIDVNKVQYYEDE